MTSRDETLQAQVSTYDQCLYLVNERVDSMGRDVWQNHRPVDAVPAKPPVRPAVGISFSEGLPRLVTGLPLTRLHHEHRHVLAPMLVEVTAFDQLVVNRAVDPDAATRMVDLTGRGGGPRSARNDAPWRPARPMHQEMLDQHPTLRSGSPRPAAPTSAVASVWREPTSSRCHRTCLDDCGPQSQVGAAVARRMGILPTVVYRAHLNHRGI